MLALPMPRKEETRVKLHGFQLNSAKPSNQAYTPSVHDSSVQQGTSPEGCCSPPAGKRSSAFGHRCSQTRSVRIAHRGVVAFAFPWQATTATCAHVPHVADMSFNCSKARNPNVGEAVVVLKGTHG